MVFGINDDPYNPSADNIELMICDYREKEPEKEPPKIDEEPDIPPETPDENPDKEPEDKPIVKGWLSVEGRKTIRAGSGRTYTVSAIDKESGETVTVPEDIKWSIDGKGISIEPNGATCKVTVKEDDNLVGAIFTIQCACLSGEYVGAEFSVEVT